MKVLDRVYERYLKRKKELEDALSEALHRRELARAEGDLSENADYKKAMSDIDLINHEYIGVAKIVDEGEPVQERINFNEIDIGCKFNIDISIDIDRGNVDEEMLGVYRLSEVQMPNGSYGSLISGTVVIGGETDEFATEGIISATCPLGKYLMGKSFGTYNTKGPHGDSLKVVISRC